MTVVGLKQHGALVAAEGLFDVGYPFIKFCLGVALLFLYGVGAHIKGQNKKVYGKTQRNNGKSRVLNILICNRVNNLEDKVKRFN